MQDYRFESSSAESDSKSGNDSSKHRNVQATRHPSSVQSVQGARCMHVLTPGLRAVRQPGGVTVSLDVASAPTVAACAKQLPGPCCISARLQPVLHVSFMAPTNKWFHTYTP